MRVEKKAGPCASRESVEKGGRLERGELVSKERMGSEKVEKGKPSSRKVKPGKGRNGAGALGRL